MCVPSEKARAHSKVEAIQEEINSAEDKGPEQRITGCPRCPAGAELVRTRQGLCAPPAFTASKPSGAQGDDVTNRFPCERSRRSRDLRDNSHQGVTAYQPADPVGAEAAGESRMDATR